MSGLKEHTRQFSEHEVKQALQTPEITTALIHELTTRICIFEHFGGCSVMNLETCSLLQ